MGEALRGLPTAPVRISHASTDLVYSRVLFCAPADFCYNERLMCTDSFGRSTPVEGTEEREAHG